MLKKMMVVGLILLGGYAKSASAQDAATQNAVQDAINEAGRMRIAAIKERVKSQREKIQLALASKVISPDQAKVCGNILDKVESQVKFIVSNGDGTMLIDDYDNYTSFLDVNASLIGSQNHVTEASKRYNRNS